MSPVAPITSASRKNRPITMIPRASVPRVRCLTLLLLSLSVLVAIPTFAAEQNLLLNGDLSAGSDDAPEHWTMSPDAPPGSFGWVRNPDASPALEITTVGILSHNYWSQTVSLEQAGWYRLRALVKTENHGSRAAVQVWGARGSAIAFESGENWTPLEVYFKVVNPNESVGIGCGARGARGGRAFFRDLSLSRIFGDPPNGSPRLDIGEDLADLPTPEIEPLLEENFSGPERGALREVELAQAPPNESLLRDVLRLRVLAAVLLAFAVLTLLDWRYGRATSSANIPGGYLQDRELRRSAGVAVFLCLTLLGTWLVTRLEYVPGHGFYVVEPHANRGDEPHYLVMINGLLLTHGLHVQTVYDDVDRGGPEAGVIARGSRLDRHTIVVNQRTGHRAIGIVGGVNGGLWHRDPRPEFAPSPDTYEVSVHPPGFPVLIAAVLSLMRPRAAEVEPEVGFILMLIAWLGVVVTYFVGRQTRMSRGWAILAASILFLASPWLPYSRAYFAESTIGLAIILGVWALLSDLPILAALASAAAAAMKPPFALVAAGFFVEEVRERRWKNAVKVAAVLALGLPALAIIAHNFSLHRRILPMSQLIRTLFDPVEGLLLYAPWTIFGFLACARAFFLLAEDMRLARTMALPLFLYLIAVSSVGYGAGYCYGPRYWVAFMPWLALGAVEAMRRGGRYQRTICGALVLFGVAMAIPGALRYPQLFAMPAFDAWRGFR
jgi:hypothetical protein